MSHAPVERSDRIDELGSMPDLDYEAAALLLDSPADVIEALTQELRLVWNRYRSADTNKRRGGCVQLASGAYFQWLGFSDRVVVECTSNEYLEPAHQLSADEEERLVHWGFSRPEDERPNFWLDVMHRDDAEDAAFAIVAVMTTVFGVYAG